MSNSRREGGTRIRDGKSGSLRTVRPLQLARVGVQSFEKGGFVVLSVFLVGNGSGEVGMQGVRERSEKRGGTLEDLGVDAMVVVEIGNVADDPELIAIEKHKFSCAVVGVA
jgi:hypothetical protein